MKLMVFNVEPSKVNVNTLMHTHHTVAVVELAGGSIALSPGQRRTASSPLVTHATTRLHGLHQ